MLCVGRVYLYLCKGRIAYVRIGSCVRVHCVVRGDGAMCKGRVCCVRGE